MGTVELWPRETRKFAAHRENRLLWYLLKRPPPLCGRRGNLVMRRAPRREVRHPGEVRLHTWAMRDLGDLDRKAGDIAAATSWFVQAAEGGNAWAMKDLGDLADQRGDESTAREWWLRAVDADFSDNGLSPSSAEVALRQLAECTGDLELLARLDD